MPYRFVCDGCDFSYISPMGKVEYRVGGGGWLSSFCGACGDVCRWATDSGSGAGEREVVRRERADEPEVPAGRAALPKGPGRSAARRARRTSRPVVDAQGSPGLLASALRDDDVLAAVEKGLAGTLHLDPREELACRACGVRASLRLWLVPGETCPRCHQTRLTNDGFVDP